MGAALSRPYATSPATSPRAASGVSTGRIRVAAGKKCHAAVMKAELPCGRKWWKSSDLRRHFPAGGDQIGHEPLIDIDGPFVLGSVARIVAL